MPEKVVTTVDPIKKEEEGSSASEVKPKSDPSALDEKGVPWMNRAKEYERKLAERETRLTETESRLLELEKAQAKKVEEVEGFSDAEILREAEALEETKGIPKEQTIAQLELGRRISQKDIEKIVNQRMSRVESMALGPAYSTAKEAVRRDNPDFDRYEPYIDRLLEKFSPEVRCNPVIIQHNLNALRGHPSNIKALSDEAVKIALEKAGVQTVILDEGSAPEGGKANTGSGKITTEIRDEASEMGITPEEAYEIKISREKKRKEREKK